VTIYLKFLSKQSNGLVSTNLHCAVPATFIHHNAKARLVKTERGRYQIYLLTDQKNELELTFLPPSKNYQPKLNSTPACNEPIGIKLWFTAHQDWMGQESALTLGRVFPVLKPG
jgi:hypothetical protein